MVKQITANIDKSPTSHICKINSDKKIYIQAIYYIFMINQLQIKEAVIWQATSKCDNKWVIMGIANKV